MTNYQAARLKLANTQFENLKSAKKKKRKKDRNNTKIT